MPHKGYKQTESHKNKISWLGRRHSPDSIKKMRKPHSEAHIARIQMGALRRWKLYQEQNKPIGWIVEKKVKEEPVPPQQYRDIFMPDGMFVADGDIWEDVT